MTIDEAIKHYEELVVQFEEIKKQKAVTYEDYKRAEDHYQLAEWLKILKRVKFEFDEAIRIIDRPTPDVRDSDRKRAYAVIETFLFLQELDER